MKITKKTEDEQLAFFTESLELFHRAAGHTGEIRKYYHIAETTVCLIFAGEALIPFLSPALGHLETDGVAQPDFSICIWDSHSTGIEMLPPPCNRADFTDRGDIWGFTSKRILTAFHYSEFSVNVMDRATNTAVFWVKTTDFLPYWVFGAPLRTIFHWWMTQNGGQLLHASAVGNEAGAAIITGKGGVGKSSTALACLQHEMLFLADDYLIVKMLPEPRVYSLYCSAKLFPDDLKKFSQFRDFVIPMGNRKHDKQVLMLYPALKHTLRTFLPLRFILTPEILLLSESRFRGISYEKMQGAMSFTTMCQLPYAGEYAGEFIHTMLEKIPCFQLELSEDSHEIADKIGSHLRREDYSGFLIPSSQNNRQQPARPLISVIIPVYNGERFIQDAITNVLEQNYHPLELIVVNDGSTDGTEQIVKELKCACRYFSQENAGPATARNRGIQEASGELIAFLDVDDLWPANNLFHLLEELISDPNLQAVHGFAQLTEWDPLEKSWNYIGNPRESFPGYIGAGLYKKTVFDEVGLFDPFLIFGEDADWFKRASELMTPIRKIPEVSLYVRRHGGNLTEGKDMVELNALKVFKKSLDRARNPDQALRPKAEISVIIPVYNGEKYLSETLQSILQQTILPEEIIVVDDGSTDSSVEVVRQYGTHCRLVLRNKAGAAAARNAGIMQSACRYLAFSDADDLWEPAHNALLLKEFEDNPGLEMVMGKLRQFVSPDVQMHAEAHFRDDLEEMEGYHPGCILIKREAFLKVGLMNENLHLAEVVDWFARAESVGLIGKTIDIVVYRRRIHTSNQGLLKRNLMNEYTSVLREAVKRHNKQ
jgi:glycosyltransferase involved in cell wall biosynthesis